MGEMDIKIIMGKEAELPFLRTKDGPHQGTSL